jgi:hypothetical protein
VRIGNVWCCNAEIGKQNDQVRIFHGPAKSSAAPSHSYAAPNPTTDPLGGSQYAPTQLGAMSRLSYLNGQ